ncbi:MAG: DarT ssDNA thymidine ADP-ribosyltransferase family protein [Planctomycetota bacterium]|jgi:O-acetyl-ADP-ribose deacetylase (regulator of RNase III)
MKKAEVKGLFYITHVDNLGSIVKRGILAHSVVERERVSFTPIYDKNIVARRREKTVPAGASLWDYANLYFQPRNPMMYRVICEKDKANIAVVSVRRDVLTLPEALVSDGNAANEPTLFYPATEGMKHIEKQWGIIQNDWWRTDDGSKRKIMSECLVPDRVPPELLDTVYVPDHKYVDKARRLIAASRIPVVPEPRMFFRPRKRLMVGDRISLVDGDMFFSSMQTLTVSVNVRGVMGKGLASRAKYQFPDVYVQYQDACRSRRLTPTRPFLYKREVSLEEELADLTTPLPKPNAAKWFLLFATKRHWRDKSRLDDIEAGLEWIKKKHKSEGIQSLALPALGCGLGGLNWREVGPVMCRYLSQLEITSAIYLPRERQMDPALLTAEYLLPTAGGL